MQRSFLSFLVLAGGMVSLAGHAIRAAEEVPFPDHIGHTRHIHHHNDPHRTVVDPMRFFTTRKGAELDLPVEDDAFCFVVFGDRTGGPPEGVSILADAVRDVNLFEPDLVMTVGDLVQGYNDKPLWEKQAEEFTGIMDHLICPWFPVAGNHDVYWRGEGQKPEGENEQLFEMHFGPLWYAFEHKNSWFIALYSDEGDPETGRKDIHDPACQKMSPEQFEWLKSILEKAKGADHVFCFLHHPRWLGGQYGDDWDRVHKLLSDAGNVSVVFAGHIHHMRYDPQDNIEYVTLATVGGGQSSVVPSAGFLHQYHVVMVRKNQIAMACIPVGAAMDPRDVTGKMQDECVALSRQQPKIEGEVKLDESGMGEGTIKATWTNTTSRPVAITTMADSRDSRWLAGPDHTHATMEPGESHTYTVHVSRGENTMDSRYFPIELVAEMEYLTDSFRYPMPEQRVVVPVQAKLVAPKKPEVEQVLSVDGVDDYVEVPASELQLPDGSFTLECWFNGKTFDGRTGLLCKTQGCEYGFFVNDGRPAFSVFLDKDYVGVKGKKGMLTTNEWHHMAGVFDGKELRLYVDGKLINKKAGKGKRKISDLSLLVGADVGDNSSANSFFTGSIDEVRLSEGVRYTGEEFTPQRRLESDGKTWLMLHMDGTVGPWLYDSSEPFTKTYLKGGAQLVPASN